MKNGEELDVRSIEMAKLSNFSGVVEGIMVTCRCLKCFSARFVKAVLDHFSLAPTVRGIAVLTPHKY